MVISSDLPLGDSTRNVVAESPIVGAPFACDKSLVKENQGRPWPCEREGPTKWEGFSFPLLSS